MTSRARVLMTTVAVAGLMATLAGCGDHGNGLAGVPTTASGDQSAATLPQAPIFGTMEAHDQVSDGTSVTIDKIDLQGTAGWVLVHADDHGPGEVLGHVAIPEGVSTNVVVHLDKTVGSGPVWPMLHRDWGVPGVLQWPGGPDGPVRPPTGSLSYTMRRIVLDVTAPPDPA